MFVTGTKIEITRKAYAYTHMGYTDPNCIIPETVEVMTVSRRHQQQEKRQDRLVQAARWHRLRYQ